MYNNFHAHDGNKAQIISYHYFERARVTVLKPPQIKASSEMVFIGKQMHGSLHGKSN